MTKLLWTVQGLLAAVFIFAGSTKFVMSVEQMQQGPVVLPGAFLHFIGLMEILGGLGLILPGLLHIRPGLTPLAACGLVIIMIGAVAVTLKGGDVGPALIPVVVGALAAFVAYGRWYVAPLPERS